MAVNALSRAGLGSSTVAPMVAPEDLVETRRCGSIGMDSDRQSAGPVEAFLVALVGVGTLVALAFLVGLGFVGGTVPLLGWELSGGVLSGLVWTLALGLVPAGLLASALAVIRVSGVTVAR